jgi:tripartite-type tricarboxylate transporter receptor subunit TctC
VQHDKSGRILILATSGPERSPYTPDVATYREQGFGELMVREWFGFFSPAATPDAVKEALNSALRNAMSQQDVRDFVGPIGGYIEASTTAEHVWRMGVDSELAKRLVTALNFKADF